MIPTNSGNTKPCSPISSNCVVWQGPDLPCIELCNGDTISDVIAKLAIQLCDLIDSSCLCEPDMGDIDLSCLAGVNPTAETLQEIIQAIIDYLCALEPGGDVKTTVLLPPCWEPIYDTNGDPIIALPVGEYAYMLAVKICDILTSIEIIEQQIIDHETRITILENCVLPCDGGGGAATQIMSICINPGNLVDIPVLLAGLEAAYCALEAAVGTPFLISNATNQQCLFANDSLLIGTGTYGGVTGWQTSAGTLAQTTQNLWIVVCDIYGAVRDILENCCDSACEGLIYGFVVTPIDNGSGVSGLNINFSGSVFTNGYLDCGSTVQITDVDGLSIGPLAFNAVNESNNPSGLIINNIGGMNVASALTVTVVYCLELGDSTCTNTQTQIINVGYQCPTMVVATAVDGQSAVINWTDQIGATATYNITVDQAGVQVWTSGAIQGNGAMSIQVAPLNPGILYTATMTLTVNGVSQICPAIGFQTMGSACQTNSTDQFIQVLAQNPLNLYLGSTWEGDGPDGVEWEWRYEPNSNEITRFEVNPPTIPGVCIEPNSTNWSPLLPGADGSCIAGTSMDSVTWDYPVLTCDGGSFSGGIAVDQGCWSYVGVRVYNGATYYVYCLWDASDLISGPKMVALCCECPMQLLASFPIKTVGDDVVSFSVPFISGLGVADITIITPPTFGSLDNLGGGNFEYTPLPGYTGPDTFTLGIDSIPPGLCGEDTMTYQVMSMGLGAGAIESDIIKDVWAFIDTNTKSVADGEQIKQDMEEWFASLQAQCPLYTGSLRIAPVSESNWVSAYSKAVWDSNADGILAEGPDWEALRVLPDSWIDGPPVQPASAWIIAFSDQQAAIPFHPTTLIEGWGFMSTLQPTVDYKAAYVEAADIYNGTENSIWAQEQGLEADPAFPNGLNVTLYPITIGTTNAYAANQLMALGALTAQMTPPGAWGWETVVDLTGYLMEGLVPSAINPYEGADTGILGLEIGPLLDFNYFMFLNQTTLDVEVLKSNLDFNAAINLEACGVPVGPFYYTIVQCGGGDALEIQTAGEIEIGSAVKIEGICYEITGLGIENENIQEDLHDDCDTCLGPPLYRAEQCEGGEIIDLGPVEAEIGQLIKIGDICYTIIDELGESEEPLEYELSNCDNCEDCDAPSHWTVRLCEELTQIEVLDECNQLLVGTYIKFEYEGAITCWQVLALADEGEDVNWTLSEADNCIDCQAEIE